jgi:hypothetical protein
MDDHYVIVSYFSGSAEDPSPEYFCGTNTDKEGDGHEYPLWTKDIQQAIWYVNSETAHKDANKWSQHVPYFMSVPEVHLVQISLTFHSKLE